MSGVAIFNRPVAVLDAPSNLGLRPPAPGREPGVRGLAAALRAQGIVARLGAADAGRVDPPAYSPEPEPETGFWNGAAISRYSRRLADRVGELVDSGFFPLVLGGDCSILLGSALALRRRGEHGLLFLDAHTDFSPRRVPHPAAAGGMDLALATGRGPAALACIEGLGPYVRDEHAVLFGFREAEDPEVYDTGALARSGITVLGLDQVRALGAGRAAEEAVRHLSRGGVEGFWIHLDADVVDLALMPAVDCPEPGGLGYEELVEVLRAALGSGYAVGMEVTIYDPERDPGGEAGRAFASAIVRAFAAVR